jgi:hypothetical protein
MKRGSFYFFNLVIANGIYILSMVSYVKSGSKIILPSQIMIIIIAVTK